MNTSRAVCGCLADAEGADDRYVLMHIVEDDSEARNAEVGKQVCGFPERQRRMSAVLPDWSGIRRVGGLAVVEWNGTTDCRPTPLRLFERSELSGSLLPS